jgi:hypothetical protein
MLWQRFPAVLRSLDCIRSVRQWKAVTIFAAFREGKSRFLSADRQASPALGITSGEGRVESHFSDPGGLWLGA